MESKTFHQQNKHHWPYCGVLELNSVFPRSARIHTFARWTLTPCSILAL